MDPLATVKRIVDTISFRRRVFVWMQFEPDATGDAIVIVAFTSLALALLAGIRFTVFGTISRALSALVAWLLIAALTWAAARFIYNSRNDYAPLLRIAGFGYPTTLLLLVTLRVFPGFLGYYLSFAWLVAVMAHGTQEVMDLNREQAWGAALAGFGGLIVIQWILGGGGFI
ncbi:MAG: YIP1 family protein [Acidimicrobiia bacterium]|nr:YIP1 family protein [Acidimicrobiia bacterium]